jgi:hypothetical protein
MMIDMSNGGTLGALRRPVRCNCDLPHGALPEDLYTLL